MLDVERWAELRREHFFRGVAIKELARRTGLDRNTVRRALRSDSPPRYARPSRPSKLEPFKDEIHQLLRDDPRLPGKRVRELIEPLGYVGGRTIVDDYLREVRPLFLPRPRTFQRTVYRPGEICQFDLWEPSREIPVGHGQLRRGYVVAACLGYSRAGAGALVFSKEPPDLLFGIARCLWSLGALPKLLVWDRQAGLHAREGRPTAAFAAFCGQLRVGWRFCEPADPQAKGVVERLQNFLERSFEPGRAFANERDFQLQLDGWFEKANARTHKTLRVRPIDRLREERAQMAPLPLAPPDTDRRFVTRVPADPHVRVDTNDYSLDPRLVGRRVEVRVSQAEVRAVALETGEPTRPPPAQLRAPLDDHRVRACPRAARASPPAGGAGGRGAPARPLRRADQRVSTSSELAHLFRALKAPAAARALPKLADRPRRGWSYEHFGEALLQTEHASREAHGGEGRIRGALPGPQDAREVRPSASSARSRRR